MLKTWMIDDTVRVKEGAFVGKIGKIEAIATDVPKSVGVRIPKTSMLVWFRPAEVEVEKGEDDG